MADLFWHSLAAKGGNEGRWSDAAQQSADEQVLLFIIILLSARVFSITSWVRSRYDCELIPAHFFMYICQT